MPAVQRSEFALALNQVATERGVDISVVLDTVKNAILAAYRKDHPGVEVEEFTATLNANTGEARILHKDKDVTPPGFGRIAAQTAKQVILQKIREKEKEAILTDYKVRIGTIVNGMVLRFAGPTIVVDIGKAEGVMPVSEQIPNEKYHLNQRIAVHLLEIREGARGEEILVSRASNGLLEGLFKREVPEIAQGSVVIKDIVREPGNRSKVAVSSNQAGIDPVGSCVGQKGVRVQAIIQEFSGLEKIDIIQWQEDPKTYIAYALSPAKKLRVELDEKGKIAHVFVDPAELSLAIGREGQNARLASKLTGYRIEIEAEEVKEAASAESSGEPKEETPSDASSSAKATDDTKAMEGKEETQETPLRSSSSAGQAKETKVEEPKKEIKKEAPTSAKASAGKEEKKEPEEKSEEKVVTEEKKEESETKE